MAKDNLFLGMARGSIGSVTFSRVEGKQISRARNTSPRNPQSPAQMIQRIVMSTVGKAYSFMREICDHSFEGYESGQQSQRKFIEANVSQLRDSLADLIAYPVESEIKASQATNFSYKNDYLPVLNRYQISAGSLPRINLVTDATQVAPCIAFDPGDLTTQTITYQDIIDLLGLQRGDQLTFIQITNDNRAANRQVSLMSGFRYARVILDPSDGDLSSPFIVNNAVNKPNERNEGSFRTLSIATSETRKGLTFILKDVIYESASDRHMVANSVILSRLRGSQWLRSEAFIEPNSISEPAWWQKSYLNEAYESYKTQPNSDLYLNQAE